MIKKNDIVVKHFRSKGMGGQYSTALNTIARVSNGQAFINGSGSQSDKVYESFSIVPDEHGRMGYRGGDTETWFTKDEE